VLHTRVETEYRKLFARLMGGFVTRHAQRKLSDDLARLKQLAEAE
jgi:hypothetical protein